MTLTFDLLTLKVVSESRVTILVFLGLSVLDLGPMYAKDQDRQTDRRQTASSLNAPPNKRENRKQTQQAGRSTVAAAVCKQCQRGSRISAVYTS